jgi:2,5-dihydroxypyridine 5,6-dioxygenase
MNHDLAAADLYERLLRLCKLGSQESLAVLTEGGERDGLAAAMMTAAQRLGAQTMQINLAKRIPEAGIPMKRTALTANRTAVETLKSVDMVVDMVGLLWSPEQREIQDAGARVLMCKEPIEIVARMFPTEALRRRVEAGEKRLAAAGTMRITSDAGTNITYQLKAYPVITQYGYTDMPGRWDNCPGGFLYTAGADDGVNGVVVMNTGDIIFPFKRYVSGPIRFTVERGKVVGIDGASIEAELLRGYMRRWNDPRAYAVSHIGWGMDEKAQWDLLGTSPLGALTGGVDGRSFYGNVLFSTGPNNELGGSNDTACHLDLPLRGCDLYLDNELIVEKGELRPAELRP